MPRPLASFPEELLLRILALVLDTPASDLLPPPPRHRTSLLLVSRQFLRIASPLLYHTIHLHSSYQAARARDTLAQHPTLASAVRRIVFAGIWHTSADLLSLCHRVYDVDIRLDGAPYHSIPYSRDLNDFDAETFCSALEQRQAITHLTIRKDPAVYLTHPRPIYVLQRLAQAVRRWTNLETVHFALRISASSTTLPLARALSVAPRLRSVRAQLPAVWNNLLLVVSTNPRLEKVMLYSEPMFGTMQRPNTTMGLTVIKDGRICDDIEHAIFGTGLYMMEAKKHARFSELIGSGTSIIRTRAHTTIATLSIPTPGETPLGAIRAKEVLAAGCTANVNRDSFGLAVAPPLAMISGRHTHAQDVY